jgi:hypothetical protein
MVATESILKILSRALADGVVCGRLTAAQSGGIIGMICNCGPRGGRNKTKVIHHVLKPRAGSYEQN